MADKVKVALKIIEKEIDEIILGFAKNRLIDEDKILLIDLIEQLLVCFRYILEGISNSSFCNFKKQKSSILTSFNNDHNPLFICNNRFKIILKRCSLLTIITNKEHFETIKIQFVLFDDQLKLFVKQLTKKKSNNFFDFFCSFHSD